MKTIVSLFEVASRCVLFVIIGSVVCLTVVTPPPTSAPNGSTVAWKADADVGTKALLAPVFAMTSWEVTNLGPISLASGRVPLTNKTFAFVGVNGRWYSNQN